MEKIINNNFLFFDVETPNSRNDSICSISIIYCEGTKEILKKDYLINPETDFSNRNILINGITSTMVEHERTFPEVWKEIGDYFYKSIVVAHNASFDLNVLNKCLFHYGIDNIDINYICTYCLARKYYSYERNTLDYLCGVYNIRLDNHHDASCDTSACKELFYILAKENFSDEDIKTYCFDITRFKETIKDKEKTKDNSIVFNRMVKNKALNEIIGILEGITYDNIIDKDEIVEIKNWLERYDAYKDDENFFAIYKVIQHLYNGKTIEIDNVIDAVKILKKENIKGNTLNTLSLQVLKGIITGILTDGIINKNELDNLYNWLIIHKDLKGNYPFDKIYNKTQEISDGELNLENQEELIAICNDFINPKKDECCSLKISGSTFCLTGSFVHGTKTDVANLIEQNGGIVVKSVTKSTNYVIMGGSGSEVYKFGNYGSKVQKALEMKENGHNIEIIDESNFYKLLP